MTMGMVRVASFRGERPGRPDGDDHGRAQRRTAPLPVQATARRALRPPVVDGNLAAFAELAEALPNCFDAYCGSSEGEDAKVANARLNRSRLTLRGPRSAPTESMASSVSRLFMRRPPPWPARRSRLGGRKSNPDCGRDSLDLRAVEQPSGSQSSRSSSSGSSA
jgi:hypothetical protein